MRCLRGILFAALVGCTLTGSAQTILLDSFNAGSVAGSVRAGTTWVGQTTPNATTLTVGGTAQNDNGWGATGLTLNATGMNFITVTAQRDAGNAASTFAIQFEDRNLNTQIFSVSMAAFAIGSLTSVQIPITAWNGGFSPTQITSWTIGGGGLGTSPFRMTFDNLALNATATTGTVVPGASGDFGAKTKTAGESIAFAITATGTAPLTYQWFKNATVALTANPTATTAELTLSALTPSDAGTYTCTVTNSAGSIVSGAFILTVTAQPATITLGSLTATYTGAPKPVTATTTPAGLAVTITYSGTATTPTNAGTYPVIATVNDATYAGSAAGTLVIAKAAQTIALGALPTTLVVGTPISLAATATSGGPVAIAVAAGNATLAGTSLTPNSAAPITLRLTQEGSANYLTATTDFSFTTTKQNQSITFAPIADQPASVTSLVLAATASSNLPVTFTIVSGPATLNGSTLAFSGPGSVSVRASQPGGDTFNPASDVTRTFNVAAAQVVNPPVIVQAPAGRTLVVGSTLSLSVVATGIGPLSYQWFKDNTAIAGATGESFSISVTTAVDAGAYRIDVTNSAGTTRSSGVAVVIATVDRPTGPSIARQPGPQVAVLGGSATFSVVAVGAPAPTFQWRKNGLAIAGATNASFTLLPVLADAAGAYEVVVSNPSGSVTSSLASLTLVTAPVAPVITRQPANVTAVAGRSVALTATGSATPAPSYQWRKDGVLLVGAISETLTFNAVQEAQAGKYTVTLTNSVGSVTSREAFLRVPPRSYAGQYFGTLGTGGAFALHVREDHTGVFLGFTAAPRSVLSGTTFAIDDRGNFQVATTSDRSFTGTITAAGALTGTSAAAPALALSATRAAVVGPTQALAGFYDTAAANLSGRTWAVVNATGQILLVTQTAATSDAGLGTTDAAGVVRVTTLAATAVTGTADASTLSLRIPGPNGATTFSGINELAATAADQRLLNNSTRARAGAGQVAIAGFVITGEESKPVLIRAIGPALAGFGVPGALAAPSLELYAGATVVARNTGWASSGAAPAVAAASARVAAFALDVTSADAALLTTLAPGAYTAVINSSDARPGIGLVEVYDLSGATVGQRISNLSVRAFAGTDADTLIVGVVVQGTVPKRLLIRAVGPTLAAFGVADALARPLLALFSGSTEIARNVGWSTSPDATQIAASAAQVGAFALPAASADSALVINLAPGAYTSQVSASSGAPGVALVEIYELP